MSGVHHLVQHSFYHGYIRRQKQQQQQQQSVQRSRLVEATTRPLKKGDLNSMVFAVNRFFMKLFRTGDINIVKPCQSYFSFNLLISFNQCACYEPFWKIRHKLGLQKSCKLVTANGKVSVAYIVNLMLHG